MIFEPEVPMALGTPRRGTSLKFYQAMIAGSRGDRAYFMIVI
jgi:hypothetical protein